MRLRPLPLAVLALAALLTGCVSVSPDRPGPPRHQPAGRSLPLTPAPPASPSPPVQPHGTEELAWIGPSPAPPVTADRPRRPAVRPEQPRTVPTPGRVRPAQPRQRLQVPAAPPRSTKRWAPRVPTGGGMRSVCRSAQGIVSPGLAGMCRSIGR
ncbi:hypothetical protein ABZX72_34415 [Streptomyces cyaneofuscatus]|uniref:hypothetical protein n=1 Tax=Streptomyces cyaneofuscatus TaxID=66883 RepID=UPI0033B08AB9